MTTDIRTLTPLHRVATPNLLTRMAQALRSASREIVQTIQAAADLRNELRRMADEIQHTRPEQAARLRRLANSSWSD